MCVAAGWCGAIAQLIFRCGKRLRAVPSRTASRHCRSAAAQHNAAQGANGRKGRKGTRRRILKPRRATHRRARPGAAPAGPGPWRLFRWDDQLLERALGPAVLAAEEVRGLIEATVLAHVGNLA